MTYNTTGIILKYRDIGEFDRIYSILTSDHGKVEAWAQGVRKPQSKLVAHLQPLYLCDFMFARGRRFDRVAQVKILERFPVLWADLEKLSKAVYAAALVDLVLRPGTRERAVFELFLSTLKLLEKGDGALELMFALKLVRETGFSPELRNCVLCKKEVDGLTRYFDAIRGGVLCNDCFVRFSPEAFPISSLTLETLESILNAPLARLELPQVVRQEFGHIVKMMIEMHFGERPKSQAFIDFFAREPLAIPAGV
ncbi:DNA repair protein RecO [Candidatus Uhrbacteria bacterium]|nr:DNA repair protein RecO [Candidatus Uhrbacteria bacterium]